MKGTKFDREDAAMKNTQRRAAILAEVSASQCPVSAEEIFQRLRQRFPTLALSTVYRNLERFAADGLIEREISPDGVSLYSEKDSHGHYLVCTRCHSRIRLHECPLSAMEEKLEAETGFSIDRHQLTLYGKCPACKKQENSR